MIGRKYDNGKLRWDLLPWNEVEEIVKVVTYGANKYGDNNWKELENAKRRYSAALIRHFVAWYAKGEKLDSESGLHHLAHLACNTLFLLYFEKKGRK